jgi:DNA ligase-1
MDKVKMYTVNVNGKIKEWTIEVTGTEKLGTIIIKTGLIGGKVTTFETIINKGKNLDKKNATTALEQAVSEAKSKINKKKDMGFTFEIKKEGDKSNELILPMLATNYKDAHSKIKFDAFCQPKIDGLRAVLQNGSLYSRLKNKFLNLDHILDELKECPFNLDGELYSSIDPKKVQGNRSKGQDTFISFQELNGLVKKKTLTKNDTTNVKHIIYIVYDAVIPKKTFQERYSILKEYFSKNKFKYIKLLETEIVKNPEDIIKYQKKYILQGYEGIIIRNADGLYKQKNRSNDLQKFKNFQDDEFKIIGITENSDSSTEKGCIIWICEAKNKKEFKVRPIGSFEERRKLFKDGKKYIGEMLTVRYFDLTDDGVPFHASTLYGGIADIRSITQI